MSSPERVDELLSQQAHRGRAQDDDALLVQPDDALIGPEIEELGELQWLAGHVNTSSDQCRAGRAVELRPINEMRSKTSSNSRASRSEAFGSPIGRI